jgi:hypothetical protein
VEIRRLLTDVPYRHRVRAVKTLTEAGWSVREIAFAVGMKPRQVKRDRKTVKEIKGLVP